MLDLILNIVNELWGMLQEMSPYLLLGFFIAGLLEVLLPGDLVHRHLGSRGFSSLIKASIFGVPLPLCSCGVIPVAASLRASGASRGATTSFLISTPQTGVDSIAVTYSLLGTVFAIFRPVIALINGIIGGLLVQLLEPKEDPIQDPYSIQGTCNGSCSLPNKKKRSLARIFSYGFVDLPGDIAKALVIGIIISGLIAAMVPDDFFVPIFGTGLLAMLVMMAMGIPVYVCATASVPIAASLIDKGITPGAALVFLIVGPATNAATISTIWKVMGKRTAMVYLVSMAVMAIASGLLLDYIFSTEWVPAMVHNHPTGSVLLKNISAVLLLLLIGYALYKTRIAKLKNEGDKAMNKTQASPSIKLKINGMTCSHCVQTVSNALKRVSGVRSVEVSLKTGQADIYGDDLRLESLIQAVEKVGYSARAMK